MAANYTNEEHFSPTGCEIFRHLTEKNCPHFVTSSLPTAHAFHVFFFLFLVGTCLKDLCEMMWRCVNSSLALPPTKSFAKCAWWLSVLTASFVLGFALSMFIGDLDAISLWKQLQVADRIPRFNATYMPEPQHENSRVLLLAYPR